MENPTAIEDGSAAYTCREHARNREKQTSGCDARKIIVLRQHDNK